ncbi:hypothetical protein PMI36_00115 [Pseudomonas sp. GM79]|uniref:hypothetical protein n=1 Tax=Pseudomonas sp. GM79 TaxID=1144338 RepID=UPI00026FB830|nr:hypothetical protein [Pseudomonas sp. GM79]EJN28991.1 hypothetical protein PMI36_00115 [Pseudomonas sp. GM79]
MTVTPLYNSTIIDSHIRLFDPHRPQGAPWPEPGGTFHAAHLPEHYWKLAAEHHVIGAITAKACPWRGVNV